MTDVDEKIKKTVLLLRRTIGVSDRHVSDIVRHFKDPITLELPVNRNTWQKAERDLFFGQLQTPVPYDVLLVDTITVDGTKIIRFANVF